MQEKPYERKKLLAVGIVAAVLVVLGILAVVIIGLLNGAGTKPTTETTSDSATTLFYDTLGNAAKQQQLRVAMYRATFANKADADNSKNTGTQASSVAEVDIQAGKARSVFTTNASSAPNFAIGRCVDGTHYTGDYTATNVARPTTLQAAADDLNNNRHLYKSNVPIFDPCPELGIIKDVSVDLASFRYSDGVFPVTLTDVQADAWKKKVQEASLFTVKDEGMVERGGKQLKKISFTPKNNDGVNSKLYTIYNTAEIAKIQTEHPNAAFRYSFISINPDNTGSVGGYYLIDERTKLPVYSELYGTNADKESQKPASRFNIARTKQTYQFGAPLSMTVSTPLEILE
jgi:hypothetical protein